MGIKKAYYYLFYKLYRFSEAAPSRWMSDWKSSLAIDVLLLFTFSSILNYYKALINPSSHMGEGNLLFVVIIIVGILNYFIFHHADKWKEIVEEFDNLPRRTNKIGSWIILGILLLLLSNFIFSFYLYYQTPV